MDPDYEKLKKLGPDFDCGYCGNASCAAFLRRLYAAVEEITSCPFIQDPTREKIQEILARHPGVHEDEKALNSANKGTQGDQATTVVPIPKPDQGQGPECVDPEYAVSSVQFSPCAEKEKLTMEVRLALPSTRDFSLLDSCDMCITLSNMKTMDRVSCSRQMGYAAALIDGKRLHVFKNGKVILRRADSQEDALRILRKLKVAMRPSVVNVCGNTLADCLLCHDPSIPGYIEGHLWGLPLKMRERYTKECMPDQPQGPCILPVLKVIRNFIQELKDAVNPKTTEGSLTSKSADMLDFLEELPGKLNELLEGSGSGGGHCLQDLLSSAVSFQNKATAMALERSMEEALDLEKVFYGVIIHGMAMSLRRALEALGELLMFCDPMLERSELCCDQQTICLSRELVALFRMVTSSFVSSIFTGERAVQTPELEAEFTRLKATLEELTHQDNDMSPELKANIWKMFNNSRYLDTLLDKHITITPGTRTN